MKLTHLEQAWEWKTKEMLIRKEDLSFFSSYGWSDKLSRKASLACEHLLVSLLCLRKNLESSISLNRHGISYLSMCVSVWNWSTPCKKDQNLVEIAENEHKRKDLTGFGHDTFSFSRSSRRLSEGEHNFATVSPCSYSIRAILLIEHYSTGWHLKFNMLWYQLFREPNCHVL